MNLNTRRFNCKNGLWTITDELASSHHQPSTILNHHLSKWPMMALKSVYFFPSVEDFECQPWCCSSHGITTIVVILGTIQSIKLFHFHLFLDCCTCQIDSCPVQTYLHSDVGSVEERKKTRTVDHHLFEPVAVWPCLPLFPELQ